jgi:hypothetical protein
MPANEVTRGVLIGIWSPRCTDYQGLPQEHRTWVWLDRYSKPAVGTSFPSGSYPEPGIAAANKLFILYHLDLDLIPNWTLQQLRYFVP